MRDCRLAKSGTSPMGGTRKNPHWRSQLLSIIEKKRGHAGRSEADGTDRWVNSSRKLEQVRIGCMDKYERDTWPTGRVRAGHMDKCKWDKASTGE